MAETRPELAAQGERIRALRLHVLDERGRPLSQEKLAQKVGVSTKAYRAWERGQGGISVENLERLAAALNATTDQIRAPNGATLANRRQEHDDQIRKALQLVLQALAHPERTPTAEERQALLKVAEELGGPLEQSQDQPPPAPHNLDEVRRRLA